KTVIGSPHAAARRADPHPTATLIARAIHEEGGGAACGDLIATGEAEHTRLEGHQRADGRPFERGLTMAAAFDPLEVLLRLIDLILPNRGGRPCLSRGQLLGRRERGTVA